MYCSEEYKDIEEKILKGERLSREDSLRLFACNDIAWLGNMADMVRKRKCGTTGYIQQLRSTRYRRTRPLRVQGKKGSRTQGSRPH